MQCIAPRSPGWDPVLATFLGLGTVYCLVGVLWLCCGLWGSAVATHCSDSLGWRGRRSCQGAGALSCQHDQLHLRCQYRQPVEAAVSPFKTNPHPPSMCVSIYGAGVFHKGFWKSALFSLKMHHDSFPLSVCGLKLWNINCICTLGSPLFWE